MPWGGSLRNRYRFLRDIIHCIRDETGPKFHLRLKISAADHNDALYPWKNPGNRLQDTIRICQWAEQDGVDALHISSGSLFPHPRNPAGDFPLDDAVDWSDLSQVKTQGLPWPIRNQRPCSYCNRCLINDIENPLGCYDPDRFESYEQMMVEIMSVFRPDPFSPGADPDTGSSPAASSAGPSGSDAGTPTSLRELGETP